MVYVENMTQNYAHWIAESVDSLVAPALDGDTFLIAGMREDLLPTIQEHNVTRHEAASFLYLAAY